MRRRGAWAEAAKLLLPSAPPVAPIKVVWATPEGMFLKSGTCPKCGGHFGRRLRAHTLECQTVKIP